MSQTDEQELIKNDISAYLKEHENKEMLRFITCGSVDDGKSTLIGRLLFDSKVVFEDQLSALKNDSKKLGTTGEKLDFALLVDGLASEREQGITIDVAYRFFSTKKRKFIIADTPGHEQYTRNMATGASTADLAIILIDARSGVLTQTKRHSYIASLLGIKNIIIAVNKMDLVNYSKEVFDNIVSDYKNIINYLPNHDDVSFRYIPICAVDGDNIVKTSDNLAWWQDESLLEILDSIPIKGAKNFKKDEFRFPVQYVNRPHLNFRGYCGTITSGEIKVGDVVSVLPSLKTTRIKSIIGTNISDLRVLSADQTPQSIKSANSPMAVTITLEDEVDVSRGDMIVKTKEMPKISNSLDVSVVWMNEIPLKIGTQYIIKRATSELKGVFKQINYKKNINTFERENVDIINLNDIASCTLQLDRQIALDNYADNRYTGGFIIIDKYTNATLGAGMITNALIKNESVMSKDYTKGERELNSFIRTNYPQWGTKEIN